MHRPSIARLASLAAMFAGLGKGGGMEVMAPAAQEAGLSLAELAAVMKPLRRTGPGKASKLYNPIREAKRVSGAYLARQQLKKRWLEGKKVPADFAAGMQAAAERRAPINARRVYRARRSEGHSVESAKALAGLSMMGAV